MLFKRLPLFFMQINNDDDDLCVSLQWDANGAKLDTQLQ